MGNVQLEDENDYLDIGELIKYYFRHVILIGCVGFIFAICAYAGTKMFMTPMFTSLTKIYVINKETTNALTVSDFAMANYLTADYGVILKTEPIAAEVIEKLDLDMSPGDLLGHVSVYAIDESRVMCIAVENESPQKAKEIADKYRDVASKYLKTVTGSDQVNTVEEANMPYVKSKPNTKLNTFLGGVVGCLLMVIILTILFIMDDAITTTEDIEKYIGVSVLGIIPMDKKIKKDSKAKKKRK